MNATPLRYRNDTADAGGIERHLRACDHLFHPPLSTRVDLATYAGKLAVSAHRSEAWDEDTLAGLVAGYLNAEAAEIYISNVSVLESHAGRGIASNLLQRALEQARARGCSRARLEVSADAIPALRLYQKLGFTPDPASVGNDDRRILTRTI